MPTSRVNEISHDVIRFDKDTRSARQKGKEISVDSIVNVMTRQLPGTRDATEARAPWTLMIARSASRLTQSALKLSMSFGHDDDLDNREQGVALKGPSLWLLHV